MKQIIFTLVFNVLFAGAYGQSAQDYAAAFEQALRTTRTMDKTSYDFSICTAVKDGDSVVTKGIAYRDKEAFVFYHSSNDQTRYISRYGVITINHNNKTALAQAFADTDGWRDMQKSMGSAAMMDAFLDSMLLRNYTLTPDTKTKASQTLKASYPEPAMVHNLRLSYAMQDTALQLLRYEVWRNGNGAPAFSEAGEGFVRQTIAMSRFSHDVPPQVKKLIKAGGDAESLLTKAYPSYQFTRKTISQ